MIYAFLANGFEEVEAIASVDVIRRAGIDIATVGIGSKNITGSHGITVVCDLDEAQADIDNYDGLLLPGGMPGTLNLEKSQTVNKFLDKAFDTNRLICAICAAPSILGHKNMLVGRRAVCFPGFESELNGAVLTDAYVETDGNIITAKGMGSAVDFGLAVAEAVMGSEIAVKLKESLQCPY